MKATDASKEEEATTHPEATAVADRVLYSGIYAKTTMPNASKQASTKPTPTHPGVKPGALYQGPLVQDPTIPGSLGPAANARGLKMKIGRTAGSQLDENFGKIKHSEEQIQNNIEKEFQIDNSAVLERTGEDAQLDENSAVESDADAATDSTQSMSTAEALQLELPGERLAPSASFSLPFDSTSDRTPLRACVEDVQREVLESLRTEFHGRRASAATDRDFSCKHCDTVTTEGVCWAANKRFKILKFKFKL